MAWDHVVVREDNNAMAMAPSSKPILLFSCGAKEPLDADHWIRTMEQKFGLIVCEDHEKATFAAHQLQDAAGAWWQ